MDGVRMPGVPAEKRSRHREKMQAQGSNPQPSCSEETERLTGTLYIYHLVLLSVFSIQRFVEGGDQDSNFSFTLIC